MAEFLHNTRLASIFALAGFAAFSVSDAMSRVTVHAGYSVFQVAAMLEIAAFVFLLGAASKLGGVKSAFTSQHKKLHLMRAALLCINIPVNVYAFSVLPFTFTYTLIFTGSFWSILFSRLLTGERIPYSRYIAVSVGLLGAIIVLRPWADAFRWEMILPLVSAASFGIHSLLARRLASYQETPFSLSFYPMILCVALMGVFMLVQGNAVPVDVSDSWMFLLGGLSICCGMVCVPLAFKHGSPAVVGPFHYTQLIWAAIIGALFFHEIPDLWTIIGGIIIAGSGLSVVLHRAENPPKT